MLVTTPVLNTARPMTPLSIALDLDGVRTNRPDYKEVGQWPGGTRKRRRETSPSHIYQPPFDSPESCNITSTIDASAPIRTMPGPHEHYTRPWKSRRADVISPFDSGYMSDSPPMARRGHRTQRRDQVASGPRLHHSGYETDLPSSSTRSHLSSGVTAEEQRRGSVRRQSAKLLSPAPPMEGSDRMHDKVVSFLREMFMEDNRDWKEFSREHARVGSLSNVALLRIYWFAQEQLDYWVGSRLPNHLNYKKVEIVSSSCDDKEMSDCVDCGVRGD
ncbi:hypothetical protein BC827DRAFT_197193 [Russula dissimulans]|nr:hypothetical protein BC827DRAFT_197193 [Russula dissimulans]